MKPVRACVQLDAIEVRSSQVGWFYSGRTDASPTAVLPSYLCVRTGWFDTNSEERLLRRPTFGSIVETYNAGLPTYPDELYDDLLPWGTFPRISVRFWNESAGSSTMSTVEQSYGGQLPSCVWRGYWRV